MHGLAQLRPDPGRREAPTEGETEARPAHKAKRGAHREGLGSLARRLLARPPCHHEGPPSLGPRLGTLETWSGPHTVLAEAPSQGRAEPPPCPAQPREPGQPPSAPEQGDPSRWDPGSGAKGTQWPTPLSPLSLAGSRGTFLSGFHLGTLPCPAWGCMHGPLGGWRVDVS